MSFTVINQFEINTQNPHSSQAVKEKIDSFKNFSSGWHFGEGEIFDEDILRQAKDLISFFNQNYFVRFDTFPGLNGEVMVTTYPKDNYFEVIIESDGSFQLVIENSDEEEIYSNEFDNLGELKHIILQESRKLLWSGSESFPNTTMIELKDVLPVSPSKIQVGMGEYLYIANSVDWKHLVETASTLKPTIGKSLQILSCSGV
ncbi:hypothetical protein KI659_17850 [Litoribacter alkaliphilus]|uniref:Uncharacterized protein n=1 Tax=Litoribacter ruber TaxID=702568 RepID=A0AAP2G2A9_9BACT|nr:hypothetical protein [Litoribacter alkaliphilus]MBS9525889.1 hypothetical protein [Litoribacter alkaliphilus]